MRIVVLPFEDLGPAGDPFFSLGLTQELTKDLGSLPSLQVIYRAISPRKGRSPRTRSAESWGWAMC